MATTIQPSENLEYNFMKLFRCLGLNFYLCIHVLPRNSYSIIIFFSGNFVSFQLRILLLLKTSIRFAYLQENFDDFWGGSYAPLLHCLVSCYSLVLVVCVAMSSNGERGVM